MIKKRNRNSINWSLKTVIILQKLGYLGKDGNINKEKNLSEFINYMIIDKFESNPSFNMAEIEEKYLRFIAGVKNRKIAYLTRDIEIIKKKLGEKENEM